MATNLTGGGVENHHFFTADGQLPSKFHIVIPKTPLYKIMVVLYRFRTGIEFEILV